MGAGAISITWELVHYDPPLYYNAMCVYICVIDTSAEGSTYVVIPEKRRERFAWCVSATHPHPDTLRPRGRRANAEPGNGKGKAEPRAQPMAQPRKFLERPRSVGAPWCGQMVMACPHGSWKCGLRPHIGVRPLGGPSTNVASSPSKALPLFQIIIE